MSNLFRATCIATMWITITVSYVNAQSGTRGPGQSAPPFPELQAPRQRQPSRPVTRVPSNGSGTRVPASAKLIGSPNAGQPKLAMKGYCPVCVVEMKKWMPGDERHSITYDGHVYRFPGEKQRSMFLADPAKYVPALGGDCVVCYAKMGERMPGSIQNGSVYRGRVFLFPAESQRAEFRANPAKFADVDLAMGGNCAVCKVEMGQNMPGRPNIAAMHGGLRYLFPSDEQRQMFLADPMKYTVGGN